jgi:polar amino acid transport system substrate-binding protein
MKLPPLLVLLALLLAPAAPAPAQGPTLAADPWCPYNCAPGEDRSGGEGFAIEAARLIFARAGLEVDYQILPWTRTLLEVRAGRLDAAVGASRPEAPDFVFPDEPIGRSDNGFFVRSEAPWVYLGPESLRGLRIALIADYDYGEPLASLAAELAGSPGVVVTQGNDALERNFLMLACGRVDLVVCDVAVGEHFLKNFPGRDAVRFAGAQGEPDPIYIAFSPARPRAREYARIFDQGWRELRASGELRAILERYGLKEHAPAAN